MAEINLPNRLITVESYPEIGKTVVNIIEKPDVIQITLGETISWQQAHLKSKDQIIKRLEAKLKAKEVINPRILFCNQN